MEDEEGTGLGWGLGRGGGAAGVEGVVGAGAVGRESLSLGRSRSRG